MKHNAPTKVNAILKVPRKDLPGVYKLSTEDLSRPETGWTQALL